MGGITLQEDERAISGRNALSRDVDDDNLRALDGRSKAKKINKPHVVTICHCVASEYFI